MRFSKLSAAALCSLVFFFCSLSTQAQQMGWEKVASAASAARHSSACNAAARAPSAEIPFVGVGCVDVPSQEYENAIFR